MNFICVGSYTNELWLIQVLEQLLSARKQIETALSALASTSSLFEDSKIIDKDLILLCERLDVTLSCLTHARNSFIVPNPLGFPRTLRPFNGFSPPLSREYMLEFSILRNLIVVTCLRVEYLGPKPDSAVNTLVPDPWFFDPSRLVGMQVEFEGR